MDTQKLITAGTILTALGGVADVAFYYELKAISTRLFFWYAKLKTVDMGSKIDKAGQWTDKASVWIFGRNLFSRFGFYRAFLFLVISSALPAIVGNRVEWWKFVLMWAFTVFVNFIPGIVSFYTAGLLVRTTRWARRFWVVLGVFIAEVAVLLGVVYLMGWFLGLACNQLVAACSDGSIPPYEMARYWVQYVMIVYMYMHIGFGLAVGLVAMHLLFLGFLSALHGITWLCAFAERLLLRTAERDFKAPLFAIAGACSMLLVLINAAIGAIPPIASPDSDVRWTLSKGIIDGTRLGFKYFYPKTKEAEFYKAKVGEAVIGIGGRLLTAKTWQEWVEIVNGQPPDAGK